MTPSRQGTTMSFAGHSFSGIELPDPLPLPIYGSRMNEHYMSEGESGPGIRVQEPLGAHVSYCDFEFTLGALSRAKVNSLAAAFMDQRTVRALSIYSPGESTITYSTLFAPDGLDIRLRSRCGYSDPNRYTARIRLRVLNGGI